MYTDDKATQLLVALLKEYNIKNVVISPGTRNYGFAESIQQDDFFTAYSVIDERSAAYFATGIAFETGEPVVIACTGATASRNYLSAMTEAYYRHLPIIAVTCGHDFGCPYNITPQYTDRSVSQNDVKVCSVTLPAVNDARTARHCELLLNAALTKSLVKGGGPVHINLLTLSYTCSTEKLPKVTKLDYWSAEDLFKKETLRSVEKRLAGKRIGIMIGAHKKMSAELTKAIEAFLDTHDAAVFADHTSNYHGKNKILIGQAFDIVGTGNVPEIIIDTGGVCGQYSVARLFAKGEVWRVAEDGEIKQRYGTLKNFFECREETFFRLLSEAAGQKSNHAYYTQLERLKQTEHEVYVTSRSGHPDEGNIHYIEGNAKDDDFLLPLLANGYDCIIDFMVYSTFEFVDRYKQLLAAAKQYIFLSSYRVYADNGLEPITEESPLLLDVVKDAKYRKTDEYALTKARQEKLLRESGCGNYTIVRPSVTFSKLRFQLGTLEAGVLIHRMLQKRPVVFARDILKKQAAFSWAGDVAEMIECLILNPKALGEIFNVCSAEKQTWGDVAGYYREIAGLEIVPVDLKTYAKIAGGWYQIMYDRMVDRVMDNSKILGLMGKTQKDLHPVRETLAGELADIGEKSSQIHFNKKMSKKMDRVLKKLFWKKLFSFFKTGK